MNQFTIAKQMIDFNRTAFENTFGAMCMLQEQSEKMVNAFVEQAEWMPGEGKKAISDMAAMMRKGCAEFKKVVDENFVKVEAYFEQGRPEIGPVSRQLCADLRWVYSEKPTGIGYDANSSEFSPTGGTVHIHGGLAPGLDRQNL